MNWLDGSGLRTTIYFKGCPCAVSGVQHRRRMSTDPILWDSKHYLYCNLCVSECPTGSLAFSDNRLTFTPTPVHSAVPVRITVRPECFISSVDDGYG